MPLYEYECEKCGHHFEKIESVWTSATKKCPKCGGRAERLLAAPAIRFKGSGWYVTDYARKNSSGTANEKPEDKSSAAEKLEGKSPPAKEPSKKAKKQ